MEYSPITWGAIITIFTVLGGAFAIYLNVKKLTDNIKVEVEWRVAINHDLKNLIERVNDLLGSNKDTASLMRELLEARIKLQYEIASLEKNKELMWKRIDTQRETQEQHEKDIQALKFHIKDIDII